MVHLISYQYQVHLTLVNLRSGETNHYTRKKFILFKSGCFVDIVITKKNKNHKYINPFSPGPTLESNVIRQTLTSKVDPGSDRIKYL